MKTIDTIRKFALSAAAAMLVCTGMAGVPISGNTPPIQSGSANTNTFATNGIWPITIATNTSVTNWTKIDVSGFREVQVQLTGALAAASTSNTYAFIYVTAQPTAGLYLSTNGNILPTNTTYLGLFDTITNTMNGTAVTGNYRQYSASSTPSLAGIAALYVGVISNSATQAGAVFTNYSVSVSGK